MNDFAKELSKTNAVTGPLVTIAIPTFNRALWLKDCLVSVFAQSYPKFEVLVSDNASTDETQFVLSTFSDSRLRVVRQERNVGPIPNWNFCLGEARGDYIIFVSDDDRIAPHLLERLVALVKRDPQIPIILALCDVYETANAKIWPTAASKKFGTGIWNGTDLLVEQLAGNILAGMCSIMIRTDALRGIGGFSPDIPYAGDMAAWATILLGGRAGLVNESCAVFCLHDSSLTYRLPLDVHIDDERRLRDAINNAVERVVLDPQKRREVKLFVRRYFARRIIGILFSKRQRGASFTRELFPIIWRWQRDLSYIGIRDVYKLVRPISIIVLPRLIVERIRRVKRGLSELRLRPS
jgi:glycosyltransferase involved in cell wall biosynthesis